MDKIYIGYNQDNDYDFNESRCFGNTDYFERCDAEVTDSGYIYHLVLTAMQDPEYYFTISDKVLQDINSLKCVLMFDYTFESRNNSIEHDFDKYKSIITNTLTKYNIDLPYIYVDCNPYNEHTYDLYFNRWVIELGRACLQPYKDYSDVLVCEKELCINERQYKVASFNRRPDESRFKLVNALKDNTDVLCTLGKPEEHDMDFYAEHWPDLVTMLPMEYDLNLDLAEPNKVSILTYALQELSYVQVVNESLCHYNPNHMFVNEKTFKPIACLQPFIINGMPGTLKHLHELGFKTFSAWWDESYDQETDFGIRLEKIISVVDTLTKLSHEELISMLNDMKDILEYNRKHLIAMPRKHSIDFYNQLTNLSIDAINLSA